MSVDAGIPDSTDNAGGEIQQENNGGNPAWQELYDVLPSNLHTIVAPVLDKWESGSQSKIQQYAEQIKPYESYKPFVENNVPADRIEQALQVAQLIDADPKAFLAQMQTFYGETPSEPQQQAQQQQQQSTEDGNFFDTEAFDLDKDPRFQQIKQQQDIIANFLSTQAEQERIKQEDAALEQELTTLTTKYGEFDEKYVIGLVAAGSGLEDAVKSYHTMVESIRSKPAADADLPNIITPGGGMPSEAVNPADMTTDQRKAYVQRVLAQANRQG